MKKSLALGLSAVCVLLMLSCGSDPLGTITGGKKETKAQFFNESWYWDGTPWRAELRIDGARMFANSGAWSNEAKVDNCGMQYVAMVTLFDDIWPVYVFTNVPIKCEANNLYTIRVLGLHHVIEWRTGSKQG